jgi:hypothetical protein
MNSHKPDNLIDEARLLMPWYLTNKLSAEEQKLVNKALEASAELRKEFLNEEKMMRLVKENSSLLELNALDTTEQRLANTLARIEHEEQRQGSDKQAAPPGTHQVQPAKSWLGRLFSKPLFELNWLSPANAVFAGLLVLQAGVLGYMQISGSPEQETIYSSASVTGTTDNNNAADPQKAVFLIEFQDQASHGEVRNFLHDRQARIIAGPDNMNMFSVEMSMGETTDTAAMVENIRQLAEDKKVPVSFIGPQYQNN